MGLLCLSNPFGLELLWAFAVQKKERRVLGGRGWHGTVFCEHGQWFHFNILTPLWRSSFITFASLVFQAVWFLQYPWVLTISCSSVCWAVTRIPSETGCALKQADAKSPHLCLPRYRSKIFGKVILNSLRMEDGFRSTGEKKDFFCSYLDAPWHWGAKYIVCLSMWRMYQSGDMSPCFSYLWL